MKFGIIGAGMISPFHAMAIQAMEGSSLRSVYSHGAEKAHHLATDFDCRAYTDLEKFLADPELEVVTIGTPSGAHLDPAIAALMAGKHVISEKPLEVTTARIDEMIAVAESTGKTLAAILNRRFQPAIKAFHHASQAGRFGKITSASACIKWWRTQEYYDSSAWRGTWALDGGGALMNQGIHTVDQLLHVAGPVVAVTASTALLAHERIEVEDSCVALLEFANGARGVDGVNFHEVPEVTFAALADQLNEAGITAAHENCMNWGGFSPAHTLRLIEEVPGLKLVFDTGNPVLQLDRSANQPDHLQDSFAFWEAVRDHVVHIHIKDCLNPTARDAEPVYTWPGEGQGKVKEILLDAQSRGYDGFIATEPHVATVFHAKDQSQVDWQQCYDSYMTYGKKLESLLQEINWLPQ